MGTGKTKMILDEFGTMEQAGLVDDLLVVAPAGSYRNWDQDKSDIQPSQLRSHLSPDLFRRLHVHPWVSGPGVTAKRKLRLFLEVRDRPRCLLINVEALSSVKMAVDAAADFLRADDRKSMMVVDESTTIRNDSNRTEVVFDLGRLADSRRILTGLVAPKSPLDLYRQFAWLDWRILGFESFVAFRARYAKVRNVCMLTNRAIGERFLSAAKVGRSGSSPLPDHLLKEKVRIIYPNVKGDLLRRQDMIDLIIAASEGMKRDQLIETIPKLGGYVQSVPVIDGFQNVEELHDKIAPYSYRVLKEDCLDLPQKIYQMRKVELTIEQKRMYDEIKKFATSEIESGEYVSANSVIVRMIRLHQLVCGYAVDDEEKNVHEVKSNRIKSMMELIADHDGKAIIWATYRWPIERIVEALKKEYGNDSVAQFHGGNRSTRGDDEKRFLSDPACRFMVSTQKAGGIGNTWVNASLVVYFANNHDLELRAQSEDRSHRDGLKHSVTYVDLVAEGTVDDKILETLRKKIDMSTLINGENYKEWLI